MPEVQRIATYTNAPNQSEVQLIHPFSGQEGHPDNGKRMFAYYDTTLYRERQVKHGVEIYPEPAQP